MSEQIVKMALNPLSGGEHRSFCKLLEDWKADAEDELGVRLACYRVGENVLISPFKPLKGPFPANLLESLRRGILEWLEAGAVELWNACIGAAENEGQAIWEYKRLSDEAASCKIVTMRELYREQAAQWHAKSCSFHEQRLAYHVRRREFLEALQAVEKDILNHYACQPAVSTNESSPKAG